MKRTIVLGTILAVAIGGVAVGALAATMFPTGNEPSPSMVAASPSAALTPAPTAPRPSPTPTARPTASPSPTPEPAPSLVPAPLTGRLVSEAAARRHPIAVMIDDLGAARPQSGLNAASVVWHAPAEGGIPRYMAIFQEHVPHEVGPVRSARLYYIAWAAEWRAVYVHAGGSPQALATLRRQGRGQLVYDADEFRHSRSFWRVAQRFAPHNLYTDGPTLGRLASSVGAEPGSLEPAWAFSPDAPLHLRPEGGSIKVSYPANTITYSYHRESNTYLRTVSGEGRQVDAADGKRVRPKNVVVMLMRFGPLNDGTNKQRLEAEVVGSGRAWIATNGRTIRGTWRKTDLTEPTRFFDADGRPVTLTVGQTFVQVLPTGSTVTIRPGEEVPLPTRIPRVEPTGPGAY